MALAARRRLIGIAAPLRLDVIGAGAVHDSDASVCRRGANHPSDGEYRLRAALHSSDRATAKRVSDEVLSLYCSGLDGLGKTLSSLLLGDLKLRVSRDCIPVGSRYLEEG